MGYLYQDGDILILGETENGKWTQYKAFVDRLVEFGVYFPFDDEERLPQSLPEDLSPYRAIVAPESRRAGLEKDPRITSFCGGEGSVMYMRSDPLHYPDDMTEPATNDWISRGGPEQFLTTYRPPRHDPRMTEKLCSRDDAGLARRMLRHAIDNSRRYMTYADWPSISWYPYLTCGVLSTHKECLELVQEQVDELCGSPVKNLASEETWDPETGPQRWIGMRGIPAWLYEITGDQKYKPYVGYVAQAFLESYPREPGGFFAHGRDWTAGEIGELCGGCLGRAAAILDRPDYWEMMVEHLVQTYRFAGDPVSGLEYHGAGEWGHSPVVWARGMGWSLWGVTQALESLPEDHPGRPQVLGILRRYADGLADCQSPSGLWYNVLLDPRSDLESSGSAMFVACLSKALRLGWLPECPKYCEMVDRGWRGLKTRVWQAWFVGNCTGTGMTLNEGYYWQRPFVRGGPLWALWAGAEWFALTGVDW